MNKQWYQWAARKGFLQCSGVCLQSSPRCRPVFGNGGVRGRCPHRIPKRSQNDLREAPAAAQTSSLPTTPLPAASSADSPKTFSPLTSWLSRKKISNLDSPNQPVNSQSSSEKSPSVRRLWVPNKETCFSLKASGPKVRKHALPRASSLQRG